VGFRDIVAHNVRRLRRRNHWTQQQLADMLDRHKQTVWAIEASRHGINDRLMDDLARVFGVPFVELVREEPEGEEAPESVEPGSWGAGAAGYVAESPGSRGVSGGRSAGFIEPEQVREWIRLAAREAVEEALSQGGARQWRKGNPPGSADSPRRGRSRAKGPDGEK